MMCDVRRLHDDDVMPLWKRVRRWRFLSSVSIDWEDREYFLSINTGLWRFESHGRGFQFHEDGTVSSDNAIIFIEYYPPFGGNVRFDKQIAARDVSDCPSRWHAPKDDPLYVHISCSNPTIVQEYGEMLSKYGRLGSRFW
jgi:hypothetical protein